MKSHLHILHILLYIYIYIFIHLQVPAIRNILGGLLISAEQNVETKPEKVHIASRSAQTTYSGLMPAVSNNCYILTHLL